MSVYVQYTCHFFPPNTFNPWLVESRDMKPAEVED